MTQTQKHLAALLLGVRWGMVHQPWNFVQWRDCEAMLLAAIAKDSPQAR